jgi:hypothetical protein
MESGGQPDIDSFVVEEEGEEREENMELEDIDRDDEDSE